MRRFFFGLQTLGMVGLLSASGPGLIDQPQTFPWSVGLTPVVQEEAGGLDPGQIRLKTSTLWFNTFRQYGVGDAITQQVDMEGLLGVASAAWSPAPGWEWRAQVQGWTLGSGVLDYFLSGFHGVLFLPNQGRDMVPNGAFRDFVKGRFDVTIPRSGLTQASAGVRWFWGPLSWTAWVKPPLAAPADWGWTDRWAGGTGAGLGHRWLWSEARVSASAGVTGALLMAEPDPPFPSTGVGPVFQGGFYTIIESPWGPRAVAQGSWTGLPRRAKAYLGQGAGLLTTGVQFPLDRTWTLEVALTEEFLTWATMEVGFQLGLAWNS